MCECVCIHVYVRVYVCVCACVCVHEWYDVTFALTRDGVGGWCAMPEAWLLDQEPMVTLLGGRQLHYSPDLSREEIDVLVASQSPEEQDRRFQGYLPPHNTYVPALCCT